jgi:predicted ribosomally synthesized peptide with nif11-like leader
MSLESARLFVQKVYTNRDFANQVTMIKEDEELFAFIAKQGYDFDTEELTEVNREFRNKVNGELSEAELSMVVGGGSAMFPPCTATSTYSYCTQTR